MGEAAVQRLSAFNKLSWACVYVTVPHLALARLFVALSLCSRMSTPSTTPRTTESLTYWISAILTAGETVYPEP